MARNETTSFERRRGERSLRSVRVLIYGHAPGDEPFHEESATLEIGSRGGLMVLEKEVFVGQKLLLTNVDNFKEQECKVVRFISKSHQKIVAVEFDSSAPEFWDRRPGLVNSRRTIQSGSRNLSNRCTTIDRAKLPRPIGD